MSRLPVGNTSVPTKVAGAIAGMLREKKEVVLVAIGVGAIHNAGRAIAIARIYLKDDGIDVFERPGFETTTVDGKDGTRSAIAIQLETAPIK